MVASLAPCRSNSLGIVSSRRSGSGFIAPSLASLSASSLPKELLWPFIHLKDVVVIRCLREAAAFLKKDAFFMPIQPSSSQELSESVSPLMVYFESEMMIRGKNFGIAEVALTIGLSHLFGWNVSFPGY